MKIRLFVAALAAFFMLPALSVSAYAGGGDGSADSAALIQQQGIVDITPRIEDNSGAVTVTDNIPADSGISAQEADNTRRPFTPSGTGTVIDNATGEDGKEFFTIMTPDENVFYLVIDRQRGSENVYFLNAVTEADLMALAEIQPPPAPVPVITQPTVPEPTPEPQPEQQKNSSGMILLILVVILGGGAAYYLKIYRPKQQAGIVMNLIMRNISRTRMIPMVIGRMVLCRRTILCQRTIRRRGMRIFLKARTNEQRADPRGTSRNSQHCYKDVREL